MPGLANIGGAVGGIGGGVPGLANMGGAVGGIGGGVPGLANMGGAVGGIGGGVPGLANMGGAVGGIGGGVPGLAKAKLALAIKIAEITVMRNLEFITTISLLETCTNQRNPKDVRGLQQKC